MLRLLRLASRNYLVGWSCEVNSPTHCHPMHKNVRANTSPTLRRMVSLQRMKSNLTSSTAPSFCVESVEIKGNWCKRVGLEHYFIRYDSVAGVIELLW